MPQTLLTPTIITRNVLPMLVNNLVMAQRVNRQFEPQFGNKIGTQLTVRKPVRWLAKSGPALQIQDINEPSVIVTVNKQAQVSWQYSSADYTLVIEEWMERYGKPAAETLANKIDFDILGEVVNVPTSVGTPGVTPSTFATSVQLTGQALDEQAAPMDGRSLVVNPAAYWAMAGAQSNAYVTKVSEDALIKGYLSTMGNQAVYMDQNVQTQAASTYGGTPLSNAVSPQTGSSIITNGWTSTTTTLAVGTIITFGDPSGDPGGGVYAVNPQNRTSTGKLMQFTVTAATVTDGSGNSTIAISPAIVTSGPYQNVTNGVKNDSPITVKTGATGSTSTVNNVAFCRDAFGLVCVPMELPTGNGRAARETYKNVSLRFIKDWYDVQNDVFITRLDVLYGTVTYYPEMAVRLLG